MSTSDFPRATTAKVDELVSQLKADFVDHLEEVGRDTGAQSMQLFDV